MVFGLNGFQPLFRSPFRGSWGAGAKNSVSSELFQSYKGTIEDAYCLTKPDFSPTVFDHQVKSFTGSNFRSAFGKFSKRSLSDRSPSRESGRSHRRGQAPKTARPPSGSRDKSQRVLDRNWFKNHSEGKEKASEDSKSVSRSTGGSSGPEKDELAARLAELQEVSARIGNRETPDEDDDLENDVSDGEVGSADEKEYLNDPK